MTAPDPAPDIPDHDCPRDAGTGIWCDVHVAYDRGRAAGAAEERQRIRDGATDHDCLCHYLIPADLLDGAS